MLLAQQGHGAGGLVESGGEDLAAQGPVDVAEVDAAIGCGEADGLLEAEEIAAGRGRTDVEGHVDAPTAALLDDGQGRFGREGKVTTEDFGADRPGRDTSLDGAFDLVPARRGRTELGGRA